MSSYLYHEQIVGTDSNGIPSNYLMKWELNAEQVVTRFAYFAKMLRGSGFEVDETEEGVLGVKGDMSVSSYCIPAFRLDSSLHSYGLSEHPTLAGEGVVLPESQVLMCKNAQKLSDGTYTVVFADKSYKTLRFRTQKPDAKFAPGDTLVAYLSGSDNETDYTSFAFFDRKEAALKIWRRYQGEAFSQNMQQALEILLREPEKGAIEYAVASGRCSRCGRKLTVPASLTRGLGPECFSKTGEF